MEGTTDNNLNDNRVREKEYEYLLRACANAVRENTAREKKWKRGHSGERERITDSLIKNRSARILHSSRNVVILQHGLLVSASRAGEMISRIFPGHIKSRDPTRVQAEIIKIFTMAKTRARHNKNLEMIRKTTLYKHPVKQREAN